MVSSTRLNVLRLGIFTALCLMPHYAAGMSLYRAGNEVTGASYNETLKVWVKRSFSIWAGVEAAGTGTGWIVFRADTGLGEASISIDLTGGSTLSRFEELLTTAQEWSRVAKKNHADTSKALGCLNDFDGICEQFGVPLHEHHMGLRFVSTEKGQESKLIIDLIDEQNQFKRATIYFNPIQISALLKNLQQVPAVMNKARGNASKQELFTSPEKH